MALTREQAIERLEARRRADYCEPMQWFDIGTASLGPAVTTYSWTDGTMASALPSCKLCPVLDLALAGGMDPLWALRLMRGGDASVGEVVKQFQPYTGLSVEECLSLIDFHDEPLAFDREADQDDYLVPIRVASLT